MRILSIDDGIKNLAFCLIHITSKTKFKIERWDVIDLCNDVKEKCCGWTKGKKCTKFSKYHKNSKYFCKTHAKQETYKIPTRELCRTKLKKKVLRDLKKICVDFDLTFTGKNIKKKDYLEKINQYLDENYFETIAKTKTSDLNLIEYGKNLRNAFNKDYFENLDIVIVENQIGPLALKMKVLQGMIMQHFIEKECPIIEQISPSNKLKNFIGSKKTTYGERKKLGITYTRETLQKNNFYMNWIEHFEKHKKKDDLADSFLQGIWYINEKKLI